MKFIKKYLTIYCALGISVIPFTIIKYLELKDYSGSVNETFEGVFLVLYFQLLEALVIFFVVASIERAFKVSIQSKYFFPILIVLQILILTAVI